MILSLLISSKTEKKGTQKESQKKRIENDLFTNSLIFFFLPLYPGTNKYAHALCLLKQICTRKIKQFKMEDETETENLNA